MKTSTGNWVWSIGLIGFSAAALAGEPLHVAHPQDTATDNSAVLDGFQGDVMFRTGSADITSEIAHQVQMLAQAMMKSAAALTVRVDGYADPRGSDAVNMKLSQDRAEAVLGLLLAAGVPAQVVEIHAHGKTQSVAHDEDGYALERRVRLTLLSDAGSEVFKVGQNE